MKLTEYFKCGVFFFETIFAINLKFKFLPMILLDIINKLATDSKNLHHLLCYMELNYPTMLQCEISIIEYYKFHAVGISITNLMLLAEVLFVILSFVRNINNIIYRKLIKNIVNCLGLTRKFYLSLRGCKYLD